jgi:hypothetical protein
VNCRPYFVDRHPWRARLGCREEATVLACSHANRPACEPCHWHSSKRHALLPARCATAALSPTRCSFGSCSRRRCRDFAHGGGAGMGAAPVSFGPEAAWGRCREDGEGGDEWLTHGPHMSLRWRPTSYVATNAHVAWLNLLHVGQNSFVPV